MTPRTLREWTVPVVEEIVARSLFETDEFDLKVALPDSRNEKDKADLRADCCAFANSSGGFLVFGVEDRTSGSSARLVGIDATLDFPEKFGSYPQLCNPSVAWDFLNPPLRLNTDKVIHVVHIPKSWKAPHATGDHEAGYRFLKRTNKGNEGMKIEEVRAGFLNYYEKRLRLQLLRGELAVLGEAAAAAKIEDNMKIATSYSLVTFDLTVIESVLSDTYPLTAPNTELIGSLAALRHEVRITNNKARIFYSQIALPLDNVESNVRKHNQFMAAKCDAIRDLCGKAITALGMTIGPD
jgi:Putative DNA-binding domain